VNQSVKVSPECERLLFLCRIVRKEVQYLDETTSRLFLEAGETKADEVRHWLAEPELSERLDAFVARFSRLQDTVGDKLLPALLQLLGERPGAVIDNLARAERLGWMDSAEDWMASRTFRNQMIHEYIEDIHLLTQALNAGKNFVPHMRDTSLRLIREVEQRLPPSAQAAN
jgi:Asp-tRNA(Asn)/Glu-tRNA(Gln) amidotransferase A subunit family amidase